MKLRGIEFGAILGASGVQGFFDEGYAFHRMLGPLGPRFDGMTFVAKTTALLSTPGNMPLKANLQPKHLKPRCIHVDLIKGSVLNAIALSGPGAEALFEKGKWQLRTQPFMISFMPTAKTAAGRLEEMRRFVEIFKRYLPYFKGKVALQVNVSCPSVGLNPSELATEVTGLLDIAQELGIPLVPKFNPLVPPELVVEISEHPAYDATCFSNTVPFGKLETQIPWKGLYPFGSPLAKFGGGGLSGPFLLPIVGRWIGKAYRAGMKKPMNIGGGISSTKSINYLLEWGLRPGVDSVFVGTVGMTRPWRVEGIIKHATIVLADLRDTTPLAA